MSPLLNEIKRSREDKYSHIIHTTLLTMFAQNDINRINTAYSDTVPMDSKSSDIKTPLRSYDRNISHASYSMKRGEDKGRKNIYESK